MEAANIHKEISNDNKKVAGWLLFKDENKANMERRRDTILSSRGKASNPTEDKGQALAIMDKQEAWIKLVEEVEAALPIKYKVFLQLRREFRNCRGKNGWVARLQWRYAEELAKQLGKPQEEVWINSRNTFLDWWNKIIELTARVAAKRGLL